MKTDREIVDKIFEDLRDRRFLKWLFSKHPTKIGVFSHGEPLESLDTEVQKEIHETWEKIISKETSAIRKEVEALRFELRAADEFLDAAYAALLQAAKYQQMTLGYWGMKERCPLMVDFFSNENEEAMKNARAHRLAYPKVEG